MIFKTLFLLTALTLSGTAVAQQAPPAEKQATKSGTAAGNMRQQRLEKFMEKLQKEDPEKSEELEKLRKENPDEFARSVREEVHKRQLKKGGKMADKPGKPGKNGKHGQGRGRLGKKPFSYRFLEHLKKNDPETFERIRKLRTEDPKAARKEMQKIFEKFSRKHFERDPKVDSLVNAHRNALTEEERLKHRNELWEVIGQDFERRYTDKEQHLNKLEKKIRQLKANLEKFRAAKDALCRKQLEHLLEPKEDLEKALDSSMPVETSEGSK